MSVVPPKYTYEGTLELEIQLHFSTLRGSDLQALIYAIRNSVSTELRTAELPGGQGARHGVQQGNSFPDVNIRVETGSLEVIVSGLLLAVGAVGKTVYDHVASAAVD